MTDAPAGEIYDDYILDHFECPYHKGRLDDPSGSHCERNPLCGDVVQMDVRIDADGRVTDCYFDGRGCAISQAAASILCENVEGKLVDEVRALQADDVLEMLKVPLTATRQRCGLLGFKVLKTIVYSLDDQRGDVKLPR